MAYLLDADVFIRAKNLHYGFDFCPAFWEWLVAQNASGKLFNVEKVGDEVSAIEDELSEWAERLGPGFFLRPNAEVLASLATVSAWTQTQRYEASAINARACSLPRSSASPWNLRKATPQGRSPAATRRSV